MHEYFCVYRHFHFQCGKEDNAEINFLKKNKTTNGSIDEQYKKYNTYELIEKQLLLCTAIFLALYSFTFTMLVK